jgi:hypothetical protein
MHLRAAHGQKPATMVDFDQINPSRIVPKGSLVNWNGLHGRG